MSSLPESGKAYTIESCATGSVVDLSRKDYETVSGWGKIGGANQNWVFMQYKENPSNYWIYNQEKGTKACLTAGALMDSKGLYPVTVGPPSETQEYPLQVWAVQPIASTPGTFVIGSTGRPGNVLDLAWGNPSNGTTIITYEDHSGNNGANQQWRLTPA